MAIGTDTQSEPVSGRLDASLLHIDFVPKESQETVPSGDDPIRRTQSCTTSHMLVADWSASKGWEAPKIVPYAPFSLAPTASVLHYGTECFEGLKLYRGYDGRVRLFRPELNCQRLQTSAFRAGLPDVDPAELERLIVAFLAVDAKHWLPEAGTFLYVRPAVIGTSAALGVSRPSEAKLFIVAVLFPQFAQSGPGIKLLCSDTQVRAWPGGFGNAKLGANYAPTLVAQEEGNKQGYIQILWLFGPNKHITEAGACNFFAVVRNADTSKLELLTPPLGDIILDGVTRRSVLNLARDRLAPETAYLSRTELEPLHVHECDLPIDYLIVAVEQGRLLEVFVTGTAFFIAPVRTIRYGKADINIGQTGDSSMIEAPYAKTLKAWLSDIMYGKDDHPWARVVDEVS